MRLSLRFESEDTVPCAFNPMEGVAGTGVEQGLVTPGEVAATGRGHSGVGQNIHLLTPLFPPSFYAVKQRDESAPASHASLSSLGAPAGKDSGHHLGQVPTHPPA